MPRELPDLGGIAAHMHLGSGIEIPDVNGGILVAGEQPLAGRTHRHAKNGVARGQGALAAGGLGVA